MLSALMIQPLVFSVNVKRDTQEMGLLIAQVSFIQLCSAFN